MATDWIPPIYILCNTEKEPNRHQFLLEHLPRRGIPMSKVQFVKSLWGDELTSEIAFSLYDPYKARYGLKPSINFKSSCLSRGELSLLLTFYTTMKEILSKPDEIVLVFESDVVLREDFLERFQSVLKELEGKTWDYVSLGEGVGTRPKDSPMSYYEPTKLYPPDHQFVFRCCDSMLFRRAFLEKVWQTFLPVRECLDWEMNVQMMIHRGVSLWADPPLVEPMTGRHRLYSSLPG